MRMVDQAISRDAGYSKIDVIVQLLIRDKWRRTYV